MEKPTQLTKSIGFYYVSKDNETKTSELSSLLSQKKAILIRAQWPSVPFLSVMDNVSLANKKGDDLESVLPYVQLPLSALKKERTELAPFEEIKIQLLLALLSERETLLIENVLSTLTTEEVQILLPLCQEIAEQFAVAIYLIHEDECFAHTPYTTYL